MAKRFFGTHKGERSEYFLVLCDSIDAGPLRDDIELNNFQVVFDRPQYSVEEDPANKLAAERRFFELQRLRFLKRQKRVGQYGLLVLVAFVAFSWWLYLDTVNKTTASKQITAIQTLPVVESKDMVLSLTLSDGNNIQYLIKSPTLILTLSDQKRRHWV